MGKNITEEIEKLKKERNAIILAHYYQPDEIQEIADYVGDSYYLSEIARDSVENIIVFCGVKFMGESAKILSPNKTILMPSLDSGCAMADMINEGEIIEFKNKYKDAYTVCYINSSATVKAHCDVSVTSSSALDILNSIENKQILFLPDRNLGEYIAENFKEKEFYRQRLEPPMVVTVSMMEAEALERYKDAFAGLGFTIESFGGNEYCIREVPANLYGIGERDLFMELLDAVSQENGTMDTEVIASKIATMACKMSIKGNQRVSLMEVEHLLDELMKLENPYQCPHGRPTIIKMSKYEIDKKFKRIV